MLGRLIMSVSKSPRVASKVLEVTGGAVRSFSKQTTPSQATTGRLNFLNSQRSCCPLKVCGTPACPINKVAALPNGRTWTMKPK